MIFFAKNILFLRKQKGWTQAEIHANINISRATWSNYENNSTQPDLEKLVKIARVFGVRIDDLLTTDLSKNKHLLDQTEAHSEKDVFASEQERTRILYSPEGENTEAQESQEAAIWYLFREVKAIRQEIDELKARRAKKVHNKAP